MPTENQIDNANNLSGATGTGFFALADGPSIVLTKQNNNNIGSSGTFTNNGISGRLRTGSLTLVTSATATWTWNNSFIKSTSLVFMGASAATSGTFREYVVSCNVTGTGTASLKITNFSLTAMNGAYDLYFAIF